MLSDDRATDLIPISRSSVRTRLPALLDINDLRGLSLSPNIALGHFLVTFSESRWFRAGGPGIESLDVQGTLNRFARSAEIIDKPTAGSVDSNPTLPPPCNYESAGNILLR
jgi:hypothetical protein